MKRFGKFAVGALLLGGAAFASAAPAAAHTSVGISFGFGDPAYSNPCSYYDYYDVPPPWGLPPGYCGYQVYYNPVFWGGSWYRGPIYYRWDHGRRMFWLNNGWRHDEWRGGRPARIEWNDRGRDHWRGGGHYGGGHYGGGVHFGGGHYGGGSHHGGGHYGGGRDGGRHH